MIPENIDIKVINKLNEGTLMQSLGIEFTEIGKDFVVAKMPVDERTFQPFGLLHGGANVALAETLGSVGTHLMINKNQKGVCIEINANHVGSAMEGEVVGKATLIHKGKSTHVWIIDIKDKNHKLISTSRMTMMVIDRK